MQLHLEACPRSVSSSLQPNIRAKEVPAGDGWVHEVKVNGHRVHAHKVGTRVIVYNRIEHDFTERFTSVVWAVLHPAQLGIGDTRVWAVMSAA
jgi:ATP-dependent DNA ligase